MNGCPESYRFESVFLYVYERSLQEGESAGELPLPQIAVSLISGQVREGERERERQREREQEGAELERMGGAAVLRNAKHHIGSTVKN